MSKVPFDTTEKVLIGTLIAGQALDGATTINKLDQGCGELNPIAGENPSTGTIVIIKVGISAFLLWLANFTDNHTARKVVLGIGTVVGAGAGLYNSTVECH